MFSKKEVQKLSELARIGIDEKEVKDLQKDMEKVLDFVSKLKEASTKTLASASDGLGQISFNVMREDENPHKPGEFSEELLKEVPEVEKGHVKVKKIL